jgi:hypothetical protein
MSACFYTHDFWSTTTQQNQRLPTHAVKIYSIWYQQPALRYIVGGPQYHTCSTQPRSCNSNQDTVARQLIGLDGGALLGKAAFMPLEDSERRHCVMKWSGNWIYKAETRALVDEKERDLVRQAGCVKI